MLRRGVQNIVACISNDDDVSKKTNNDIKVLFGLNENKELQVFDEKEWSLIQQSLDIQTGEGEPVYCFKKSIQVLENKYCNVEAYTPDILFVFNCQPKNYPKNDKIKAKIGFFNYIWSFFPKSVQDFGAILFMFSPHGIGTDFPYISTFSLNYKQDLIYFLSDVSRYVVTSIFDQKTMTPDLKSFVNDINLIDAVDNRIKL